MFDSLEIYRQNDGETFLVYIDDEEPVEVLSSDVIAYPLLAAVAFTAWSIETLYKDEEEDE